MSKESKPKRTRSTKKISEEDSSHTAELEAKIAELEAKLTNLSSQVKPAEAKHTHTAPQPAPKPEPAKPRPAASGPTHGTLPAGFKAPPPPTPKEEPRTTSSSSSTQEVGEVSPTYAKLSSTGYTGNKYFATRPRLSYHPANKQFKGQATTTSTSTTTAPPPPPAPEPKHSSSHETLPAGTTDAEKKSMWKAKGAEYENYVSEEETHKAPPPAPKPSSSRGTLPAGFNAPPPAPTPKEAPKPEPAKPRPAASGPTHGTLPAGFKAPQPEVKEEPKTTTYSSTPEAGEVSPTYAKLSSTGYSGNRYFATRPRLSYHPANKQFKGEVTRSTTAPTPEPAKPKTIRGTLPAGFKP